MLINEDKLSLISNKYILKSIFYHINYNRLLKLFKNNKAIQNKLGISLNDYKLQSNYPQYHFSEYFSDNYYLMDPEYSGEARLGQFCLLLIFTVIYFIYVLIYTLLLLIKNTFNDKTAQGDYNNKAHIIKIINGFNFILLAANIAGVILLFFYDSNNVSFTRGIKMKIKIILIILYNLLFLIYEGIAIWKLALSYQIKKMDFCGLFLWIMFLFF